ncbi:MAG: hypothetical protein AB7F64_03900, partial [Gammaproteobacteria bacterium]
HGLAFAQIYTEQLAYKGISEFDMGVPGIKLIPQINKSYDAVTWNIQVKDWEQSLTQLANEYASGYAKVEPKDHKACQYCDLHALCRINEQGESQ